MIGWLTVILVAAIAGLFGEALAPVELPGGWAGGVLAGLVGATVGGYLAGALGWHLGPVVGGLSVVPAIAGAAIMEWLLGLVTLRMAHHPQRPDRPD
jgi:uncharacterized membrane protein YeaQ/YmgE (transglycosylase-associated protein family)